MRLINTTTLAFEEFVGRGIPPYAILSHTWDPPEEVTYQEYLAKTSEHKKGYEKIRKTCGLALEHNILYAWVDTCCIDKSSSAELTEAINSMYKWYERSKVCYAFLSDLEVGSDMEEELKRCRWFTRGWTLQEFIAPRTVEFFDSRWYSRGSKQELAQKLSEITAIHQDIFLHSQPLSSACVAQRMSWAARRETTRVEDMAYCLLGLFGVSMAMLYGEEENAFRRLQEEIIKSICDFSLIAWTIPRPKTKTTNDSRFYSGILARSPNAFADAGSILGSAFHLFQGEFAMTNSGIKTRGEMQLCGMPGTPECRWILPLSCCDASGYFLGVQLRVVGENMFLRADPFNLYVYKGTIIPVIPETRYLLLGYPGSTSRFGLCDSETVSDRPFKDTLITQFRRCVLQVKLDPNMYVDDSWGCLDVEDLSFFTTSTYSQDIAALKIVVRINVEMPEANHKAQMEFKCIFYAVGWSSLKSDDLQYSLVDHDSYIKEVAFVQPSLILHRKQVLEGLAACGVPKLSRIAVQIPDTELCALISGKLALVKDENVCGAKFWRFYISSEILPTADVPASQKGEWTWNRRLA